MNVATATRHLPEPDRTKVEILLKEREFFRKKFDDAFADRDIKLAELYYMQCSLIFLEIQSYFMGVTQ